MQYLRVPASCHVHANRVREIYKWRPASPSFAAGQAVCSRTRSPGANSLVCAESSHQEYARVFHANQLPEAARTKAMHRELGHLRFLLNFVFMTRLMPSASSQAGGFVVTAVKFPASSENKSNTGSARQMDKLKLLVRDPARVTDGTPCQTFC